MGYALVNAVAVLIIACPWLSAWRRRCLMVGRGARLGWSLVKNAEALELMEKVDS